MDDSPRNPKKSWVGCLAIPFGCLAVLILVCGGGMLYLSISSSPRMVFENETGLRSGRRKLRSSRPVPTTTGFMTIANFTLSLTWISQRSTTCSRPNLARQCLNGNPVPCQRRSGSSAALGRRASLPSASTAGKPKTSVIRSWKTSSIHRRFYIVPTNDVAILCDGTTAHCSLSIRKIVEFGFPSGIFDTRKQSIPMRVSG